MSEKGERYRCGEGDNSPARTWKSDNALLLVGGKISRRRLREREGGVRGKNQERPQKGAGSSCVWMMRIVACPGSGLSLTVC